jgi:hypothetical protein
MPMMLDLPTDAQRQTGRPQSHATHYGHPQPQATKCGHLLHPSAPKRTPLCPACITSEVKTKMDLALKGLIAEGGLMPSDYMRDRRWQRAKLRYEIGQK